MARIDDEFNIWGKAGATSASDFGAQTTAGLAAPTSPFQFNAAGLNTNSLTAGGYGNNLSNLRLPGGGLKPEGLGMNLGTFNMVGNALGGIGDLAAGWAAVKGLSLAKKQLAQNQAQFDQNFGMQKQAYNANINQYNARQAGIENWWKKTTIQGKEAEAANATTGHGLDQFKRLELA